MDWNTLFTSERIDNTSHYHNESQQRHAFQKDFDRIIFSTAFRRLQDKTQVFPLPGPTFVHNRLTHSLEVASAGRSLAETIGSIISERDNLTAQAQEFYRHQFPWVISAACLAHDIGNPPFGHSGEDAIRHFFSQPPIRIQEWLEHHLDEHQWTDLRKYEGNSMAFRWLTQQQSIHHSDLNLTLTTIASIIKYPCSSIQGFQKSASFTSKKSNYFSSEKNYFERIVQQFDLPEVNGYIQRHPFVYLTEAADDICYKVIDLEDAHRLRLISTEEFIHMFMPFFDEQDGFFNRQSIQEKISQFKSSEQVVSYLRAIWIGRMVQLASNIFLENEKAILNGQMSAPILESMPEHYIQSLKVIEKYSVKHVYKFHDSVGIELSGYKILYTLLEELLNVSMAPELTKSKLILEYLSINAEHFSSHQSVFEKVMYVVDFVTACTDSYAYDLYKKIQALM